MWQAEMQTVLSLDVRASRLMFVNPCKQSTHIQWAARHAVDIMTFDSEMELVKIKAKHPSAKYGISQVCFYICIVFQPM